MSKKPYPYPPDEFETVDASSRPKEVHAARRSAWSRIWPFVVVIIVVPAIAFAVVKYLSLWSSSSGDDGTTPAAIPTVTQTFVDSTEPTPTEVDPGSDQTPSDTVTDSIDTASPTESTQVEAPIDRDLSVKILNAKGVDGLAGKAAELLAVDSWRAVSTGDYNGGKREGESAVYYTKNAQKASAQLVADILHIDTVTKDKSQAANGAIAVVLRADFNLPEAG